MRKPIFWLLAFVLVPSIVLAQTDKKIPTIWNCMEVGGDLINEEKGKLKYNAGNSDKGLTLTISGVGNSQAKMKGNLDEVDLFSLDHMIFEKQVSEAYYYFNKTGVGYVYWTLYPSRMVTHMMKSYSLFGPTMVSTWYQCK